MGKINTLPVLLSNPKILLIGGGKVASQKAKVLSENNIDFFVISKNYCSDILALKINYIQKIFEVSDAEGFNIIIDATGNYDVNIILKELKGKKFFLLNTVDVPAECDFYFSSLLQYKYLKIAVSSDGASPTLTQIVRDKIKSILPNEIGELSEKKMFERTEGIIDIDRTREQTLRMFGKVYLIGCGIGGAELLTIKAYKTIQTVDVVLYDHLVSDEILDIVPENTGKIFVGKSKGRHFAKQEEINKLLLDYARLGYRIARLKNGDPFVFGRGGEEAEFLIENDVDVEIIPGISSAFAAPLSAGIPPTMRGYSSGISVVTAHCSGNVFNESWIELLKRKNHTTIVLMGLTQIEKIVECGLKTGVAGDLPAAVISNATRTNQKVIVTTLSVLKEIKTDSESPAVLVFGEVVKLAHTLPHYIQDTITSGFSEFENAVSI